MEIDIRDLSGEPVTIIRFAVEGFIEQETEDALSIKESHTHDGYMLLVSEIDNLIKALQKAKELWG